MRVVMGDSAVRVVVVLRSVPVGDGERQEAMEHVREHPGDCEGAQGATGVERTA